MAGSKTVELPSGAHVTLHGIDMERLVRIRNQKLDPKSDQALTAILSEATDGWVNHDLYGSRGDPIERVWQHAFDVDRARAMLWVRVLTYSASYVRAFMCGHCGKEYSTEFHAVDDFPVTKWKDGTLELIAAGKFPQVAVTMRDGTPARLRVRIPSPKDRDRAKSLVHDGTSPDILHLVTGRIVDMRIGTGEDPTEDELDLAKGAPVPGKARLLQAPEQIYSWLAKIDPGEFADIIEAANEISADVDNECVTVCTHCEGHNAVIVPLDDSFFDVSAKKVKKPKRVIGSKNLRTSTSSPGVCA